MPIARLVRSPVLPCLPARRGAAPAAHTLSILRDPADASPRCRRPLASLSGPKRRSNRPFATLFWPKTAVGITAQKRRMVALLGLAEIRSDGSPEIRKWPEICPAHECCTGRRMRHMAHLCVTFWPEKTLESAQCDTVLAQNGGRIAVRAKKPGGAVA